MQGARGRSHKVGVGKRAGRKVNGRQEAEGILGRGRIYPLPRIQKPGGWQQDIEAKRLESSRKKVGGSRW
jgi:hypothetical protein